MPMRDQPEGVHRKPRGEQRPPREYDITVDGEPAGIMERVKSQKTWKARRDGAWPQTFTGRAAYLDGVAWLAERHRAERKTAELTTEPVTAAETAEVEKLPAYLADPFRGDVFADPLAP